MVQGAIAQHRVEHIRAAACQSDQGLVMALALGSLAVAVRPRGRMLQRSEGREEQGPLQALVAPAGHVLTVDRGPGTAGDRGDAGVRSQVGGISEVLADDLGEDPCRGPDPYPGHRDQNRVKRVGLHESLDVGGDYRPLADEISQLLGQNRDHRGSGFGADDGHSLLGQGVEDLLGERGGQPRGVLAQSGAYLPGALGGHLGRCGVAGQQIRDRRVTQPRAQDPFQGRVDLREQTPQPVRGGRGLGGQIVVEAGEHTQLSDLLVIHTDSPHGVGHRAGRVGDDRGIAGIGLGRSRVQVSDPAHHQPGQVGHLDLVRCLGHCHGQGPDRGWLIHDQQHRSMSGHEVLEDGPQAGLVVGQGLVVDLLTSRAQGYGVVVGLADVEADEHGWPLVGRHGGSSWADGAMSVLASPVVITLGIHVTQTLIAGSRLYQRSVITRPVLGDNTPADHDSDWGQRSCRGPAGRHLLILIDAGATRKVTGGPGH